MILDATGNGDTGAAADWLDFASESTALNVNLTGVPTVTWSGGSMRDETLISLGPNSVFDIRAFAYNPTFSTSIIMTCWKCPSNVCRR